MPHKVTRLEHHSEECKWVEKHLGHPNHLPPGLKEVTLEELSQTNYTCNIPEHIYYKQVYGDGLSKFGLRNYDPMVIYHFGKGNGYAVVTRWIDKSIRFFTFDCSAIIQEDFDSLPIKEDSGWELNKVTSRPMRGIRYYDRVIKFGRELDAQELKTLRSYLESVNCPGWTGVSLSKKDLEYRCHTCWDSSD